MIYGALILAFLLGMCAAAFLQGLVERDPERAEAVAFSRDRLSAEALMRRTAERLARRER